MSCKKIDIASVEEESGSLDEDWCITPPITPTMSLSRVNDDKDIMKRNTKQQIRVMTCISNRNQQKRIHQLYTKSKQEPALCKTYYAWLHALLDY